MVTGMTLHVAHGVSDTGIVNAPATGVAVAAGSVAGLSPPPQAMSARTLAETSRTRMDTPLVSLRERRSEITAAEAPRGHRERCGGPGDEGGHGDEGSGQR